MGIVEIEHLTFAYSAGRTILNDISLSLDEGENVGLIGANGVGKSTILKLMVGLIGNYHGRLSINGLNVEKKNYTAIREQTGYVFQDPDSQLFLPTVYEDVAFGPRNYGFSEQEVDRRVMEALRKVHMEELKDRQIYKMSGGQKKLASIATILSLKPELLLLDEPSVTLDTRNRRNLIHILNEMEGTKVIAAHDLDLILDTCKRTILLAGGKIVRDGATEEILRDKRLLEESGLELPLSVSGQERYF